MAEDTFPSGTFVYRNPSWSVSVLPSYGYPEVGTEVPFSGLEVGYHSYHEDGRNVKCCNYIFPDGSAEERYGTGAPVVYAPGTWRLGPHLTTVGSRGGRAIYRRQAVKSPKKGGDLTKG